MRNTLEQDSANIQTLVVAGAGLTGWLVAAACAQTLGSAVRIRVVGEKEDPEFLPIATAGRRFCEFNRLLRMPEETFMAVSEAYFRLGSDLETEHGSQRISVGQLGKGSWPAPFFHLWLRGKSAGIARPLLDYCAESLGSSENRYNILPNYPSEHGYQINVCEYTSRVRDLALALGVQHISSAIKRHGVEVSETGIKSLELESGDKVFGQLFIDCTGDRAALIGKVSEAPRESWSHWLPEDCLMSVYQERDLPPPLHTPEHQNSIGRTYRLFSQRGQLNIQSYSCDKNTMEDALKAIQPSLKPNDSVTHRQLRPGALKEMWVKNCVAIGSSAGYVDYHEPTQLQFVFRAILRLLALFPGGASDSSSASHFNSEMRRELHAMRDIIVLRRLIIDRSYSRSDVPDSLQRCIKLFEDSGFIECREDELFKEGYWAQMLLLAGFTPRYVHPVAQNMGAPALRNLLTTTHQDAAKVANSFSDHLLFTARLSKLRPQAATRIQEWRMPPKPIAGSDNRIASGVAVRTVGSGKTPVITIDNVGVDWVDSLREYACDLSFSPDRASYYPGTRCSLPNQYVMAIMSVIAKLVSDVYQVPKNLTPNIPTASFSLVTQPEQTLTTAQCIPHFDTTKPYSYAILHYLSPGEHGHTGFFRHLPTGFECLSPENQKLYLSEIDRYFDSHGQPKKQYMRSSNDHFELIDQVIYQQHRVAIYPSNIIHSAMIVPEKDIDSDPMKGRLTANIFLEFNP